MLRGNCPGRCFGLLEAFMRALFPAISPFATHRVQVSPIHNLYVEESGNPNGKPVLFLHGGPGGGISPRHRQIFDPQRYRAILFDQRGAGQSTPYAELRENTTWDLVADIERIRELLKIEKWVVFGGSWGSTLALAYAQTHPERVKALVLRGIFLCEPEDLRWFYQEGAHWIFPDAWESFVSAIPEAERGDMIKAFYKRLTSEDAETRKKAAVAWSRWEGSTIKLKPDASTIEQWSGDHFAQAIARIECHYFVNGAFFRGPHHLISQVERIRKIPARIVHGRYDVVCPVKNAVDLHRAWPESQLEIIPDAGHAFDEPGILDALMRALEDFAKL